MKYCSKCGKELIVKTINLEGDIPYCESCNQLYFTSPKPVIVTAIINDENKIVIAYNKRSKFYGLIAGYIRMEERIEEAVEREVMEETGLKLENITYMYNRIDKLKNLVFCFKSYTTQKEFNIIDTDEIGELHWCTYDEARTLINRKSIGMDLLDEIFGRTSGF